MEAKLISVIMPVYNAEAYLGQAIESIISQTYTNWELILIEDGSTDQTLQICKEYQIKDQRVRLLINDQNLGVVKSLKRGINEAKGEFIARMDADDLSHPQRFEKQMAYLSSTVELAVLGTAASYINERGMDLKSRSICYTEPNTLMLSSYFTQPFVHGSVMIKQSIFNEHNYGEDSKAEDFEFWLRLNRLGYQLANLSSALYSHRINMQGVSRSNETEQKKCHNEASQFHLEALLNRKLDQISVEVVNNRPSRKVTYQEFNSGVKLFYLVREALPLKISKELRLYSKNQLIDIHLQSMKMAKNMISKIRMAISLLGIVIKANAYAQLLRKFQ